MKKAVLPAVIYIVFYLLSLVLMTLAILLFQMVEGYSPFLMSPTLFFTKLPGMFRQVIPAATATSLILVLLVRTKYRGRNLIGSLLIVIIASALYTFPFLFFGQFPPGEIETSRFPFHEQRLTQIEDTIVYIEEIEASATAAGTGTGKILPGAIPLRGVSILHLNKEVPRLRYYPESIAEPGEKRLLLSPRGGDGQREYMSYAASRSFIGSFIALPPFLDSMLRQISSLSDALAESLRRGLFPFFLNAVAHVLFLVGSWSLIRTSRWPLWNGIFALIFFRGLFFLDSLFRGEAVLEGMKLLTIDEYHHYAAPAVFILLFVFFMMWGFFFSRPEANPEATG